VRNHCINECHNEVAEPVKMSMTNKSKSSCGDHPSDCESNTEDDEVKLHDAISSLRALVLGEIKAILFHTIF
jgi:hypothetical protein